MATMAKYIGTADVRIIRPGEWKKLGLTKQGPVVWNRANGWTVDISKLPKTAQDVIVNDGTFAIISDTQAQEEVKVAARGKRRSRIDAMRGVKDAPVKESDGSQVSEQKAS